MRERERQQTDREHKTRINDNKQVEYEETKEQTEQGVSRIALGDVLGMGEQGVGSTDPLPASLHFFQTQMCETCTYMCVCVVREGASFEKGVGAISGLVFMMLI